MVGRKDETVKILNQGAEAETAMGMESSGMRLECGETMKHQKKGITCHMSG